VEPGRIGECRLRKLPESDSFYSGESSSRFVSQCMEHLKKMQRIPHFSRAMMNTMVMAPHGALHSTTAFAGNTLSMNLDWSARLSA